MGIYIDKENYLEALCIAHPLVRHGAVENIVTRKCFFRINSDEEITESTLNGISFPCVAYNSMDGRIKDEGQALKVIKHVFKNSWLFLTKVDPNVTVEGQGKADRIQAAYDLTFGIMEDYIKAMKDEYELNGNCGAFVVFDIEKISYAQIGPFIQNEYGWVLYFEDTHYATRIIDGSDNVWGGGISIGNSNQPEIINIDDEDSKVVDWTNDRKLRFGIMPIVEVYLRDDTGQLYLSAVQPTADAAPPAFTQLQFQFDGLKTGFIIIK